MSHRSSRLPLTRVGQEPRLSLSREQMEQEVRRIEEALMSYQHDNFDDPPASESASPYPNRHSRLRRALRHTVGLAHDIPTSLSRDSTGRYESMSSPRRRRRRSISPDEDVQSRDTVSREQRFERWTNRELAWKRRRYEDDEPELRHSPIKYGHHGQVVPGRLKMHLDSCDGGQYTDPRIPSQYLGPLNALKADESVYCSSRRVVTMVLRHADDTPFCLEKLILVTPKHGFTSPVKTVTIRVGMHKKDLLPYFPPPPYAQRHQRRYSPRIPQVRQETERLTLLEALNDEQIQRRFDEKQDPAESQGSTDLDTQQELADETSQPRPDCLNITSDTEDEFEDEEVSPQDILDYRLLRLHRERDREWLQRAHEDRDRDSDASDGLESSENLQRRSFDQSRSANRAPGTRQRRATSSSEQIPLPTYRQDEGSDASVHTFKSTVRSGKHRLALRLSPPISGRFIMLTMGANTDDATNVDLQSIVCLGYAGPRFFPSIQLQ